MLCSNQRCGLIGVPALLLGLVLAPPVHAEGKRNITIVAMLATTHNRKIDPKLRGIAKEVRKLEPSLTGFRLVRTTCKPVGIGKKETFPLVDKESLTVLLQRIENKDRHEQVQLTIKAPLAGEITYSSCCSKFFPIMTRYLTKGNERLIVAIMVKPAKKN